MGFAPFWTELDDIMRSARRGAYGEGCSVGAYGRVCKIAVAIVYLPLKYLKNSPVDCGVMFCSVKGQLVLFSGDLSPPGRFWLVLWFGSLWLRLLYRLRTVKVVGERLLPILQALQSAGPFFLVVSFFLVAGVQAYFVLRVRLEPFPLYAAVFQ